MKFMTILLKEGRREDLIKKYEPKFSEENLSNVINNDFIKQTNFKYADFILKNLYSEYSFSELDEVIEALKKFDRIQNNLEKKDINTYTGFFDLISTISEYTKGKEKPKSKKIYEDDKFTVIEPQNFVASCKYGSKTRWCTTNKNTDDHFNRYTSGNQGLYYVISKKDMDENLYKIAIHIGNYGEETFYDAADSTLSKREITFFKNAFPEMWKSIKKYHDEVHPDMIVSEIKKALSTNIVFTEAFKISDVTILMNINGFELVENTDTTFMANSQLEIYKKEFTNPSELLDQYLIFIMAKLKKKDTLYGLEVEYQFGEGGDKIKIDLGLNDFYTDFSFIVNNTTNIASTIATHIHHYVSRLLKNDPNLLKYIHKTPTWRPDRIGYGYTFSKNKGLIKKLVDWLDNSTVGTKLDFLVDIGKLDKKLENGKAYYSHKDKNEFIPSSAWRGHFASFFASAKNAGILDYRKIGNQFLLRKGPNFEAFKKGELKAL